MAYIFFFQLTSVRRCVNEHLQSHQLLQFWGRCCGCCCFCCCNGLFFNFVCFASFQFIESIMTKHPAAQFMHLNSSVSHLIIVCRMIITNSICIIFLLVALIFLCSPLLVPLFSAVDGVATTKCWYFKCARWCLANYIRNTWSAKQMTIFIWLIIMIIMRIMTMHSQTVAQSQRKAVIIKKFVTYHNRKK